jgi:mannose-6-phosphate isomerase-like protein (cupin superfamily)
MIVKKLKDTAIMETAHHVDARNLYSKPEAMITVITLQPGQQLKRHITQVDVVFYVVSGTGIVEIGDEKMTVEADSLVESTVKKIRILDISIDHCSCKLGRGKDIHKV